MRIRWRYQWIAAGGLLAGVLAGCAREATGTPVPPMTAPENPVPAPIATETAVPTAVPFPTPGLGVTGMIEMHPAFPSRFVAARDVAVWLPPEYEAHPEQRYAVLYMHDGQNVFDPRGSPMSHVDWGIDETLTTLIARGEVPGAIVVAIWNTEKRTAEYAPQKPLETAGRDAYQLLAQQYGEPLGDAYLKFVVEELKPFIDREYRTLPDREHTLMMGSSMGGLASIYAICEYPEVFGGIAALSTHWPPVAEYMNPYLREHLPDPATHRIYFDFGTETLDADYEPYQQEVDRLMVAAGYVADRQWITRKFPGDSHSEIAWRNRVHLPLRFLLGKP